MELDLTRLNGLADPAKKDGQEKKQASKKPAEQRTAGGEYKTTAEREKPIEDIVAGLQEIKILQRQADAKKQDIDFTLRICREYQKNRRESSQLQAEILKGARAGEDIYSLFLKACKAVSLMTSTELFYRQIEGDIREIYGQGLLEQHPLQIELQQAKKRLQRLEEAQDRSIDPMPKERIQRAIKAHETKIAYIEDLLQRA